MMSKVSVSLLGLPPETVAALRMLGADLSVARLRRGESLRSWALRIGISVPTLLKLERGDATVGIGIFATVLWLIGRSSALAELAAPENDRGALEAEVRAAAASRSQHGRRAPRKNASTRPRSS